MASKRSPADVKSELLRNGKSTLLEADQNLQKGKDHILKVFCLNYPEGS
jgi:hypothetical protein